MRCRSFARVQTLTASLVQGDVLICDGGCRFDGYHWLGFLNSTDYPAISMDIDYLHVIRSTELQCVLPVLADMQKRLDGKRPRILELGSGSGWQAKQLSEKGFDVEAIDIESGNYRNDQVWPVAIYDGSNIPFPDEHFDVLLSSNVLEHIPHLEQFHDEMRRILKTDGIALHLVPSASWRFWTSAGHYPTIAKLLLSMGSAKLFGQGTSERENARHVDVDDESDSRPNVPRSSMAARVRNVLAPSRHGEKGNAISELYHFSRTGWSRLFENNGWEIVQASSNRLMYSGNMLFARSIPISVRQQASRVLGGSCHVFVLRKRTR